MPVLVNPKLCLDREKCFAAIGCPYGAYHHNVEAKTWEVDATICGDCPGPCLNFCDAFAVRWADDLFELDLLKQQLAGTLTEAQAAELRAAEREKAAQAEEAAAEEAAVVVTITQANFQAEVLQADLPVLMDCWAEWCGPCKQFSPRFEALAAKYTGVIKCVKLNTDEQPAIAQALGIAALPTIVMFYRGQLVDGAQGALSAQQLETWVSSRLNALRRQFGLPAAPPTGKAPAAGQAPASGKKPAPAPSGAGLVLGDAPAAPPATPGKAKKERPQPEKPKLYLP
jgi:thioredoxin